MNRYFELYKILWNWKARETFNVWEFSMIFRSRQPRKVLFDLVKIGFIKRLERKTYVVVSPADLVKENFFESLKNSYSLLKSAGLKYSLTGADAVFKWTKGAYNANRFFGYYPIEIKIKKIDLARWTRFFKKNKKDFAVSGRPVKKTLFGAFYILHQQENFKAEIFDEEPVDRLRETVEFCKKNKATFEHALAILDKIYGLKIGARY